MRLSASGDVEHVDEVISTGSGSAQLRTPKAFANFSPGFIPWENVGLQVRHSEGVSQLLQS
jgi:hypothetical protein